MQVLAWLGSILLAFCGVPPAIKAWRQGYEEKLDISLLLMWFAGETISLSYVIYINNYPLMFNYIFNFICLLVILKYKFYPREQDEQYSYDIREKTGEDKQDLNDCASCPVEHEI